MSIVLTLYSVLPEGFMTGTQHAWPLKVVAASTTEGLPAEIFVYHRGAGDPLAAPGDPYPGDRCETIASVHQLQELPAGAPAAPGEVSQTPFYRASTAFFYCRSLEEAAEVWTIIQEDARDLLENYLAAQQLGVSAVVEISALPD